MDKGKSLIWYRTWPCFRHGQNRPILFRSSTWCAMGIRVTVRIQKSLHMFLLQLMYKLYRDLWLLGAKSLLHLSGWTKQIHRTWELDSSCSTFDVKHVLHLLVGLKLSKNPEWGSTSKWDFSVVPWGFRRLLTWINWRYRHGEIYVLENGYAETRGRGLEDYDRVAYHQAYINEMLKAVILDGVNVRVYTAWSLLDQFEYVRNRLHNMWIKLWNR